MTIEGLGLADLFLGLQRPILLLLGKRFGAKTHPLCGMFILVDVLGMKWNGTLHTKFVHASQADGVPTLERHYWSFCEAILTCV